MTRVFDHLDGEPEDRWFSKIARHMQRSPWWRAVPRFSEIESRR